ncbi:MAG: tRNA/rRNA methyltransferase [Verrucomicrobia bacterium]|nr:tRNA/rRNA methyltransferase [Verrucomicrobiota bacterium]
MKELKYYGIHACLALFERRRQDIFRVYLDESNVKTFGPLLKWCAAERKVYRIVPPTELNKVSDSIHHEGICVVAKELPPLVEADLFKVKWPKSVCLLYLDGVQNPHNIGSILRTAAHFGIPYILGDQLPSLSPSACRIAKGGAEIVRLVSLKKALETIQHLQKQGFVFSGTSSHQGTSLYQFQFSPRSIIAMGSESDGVKKAFLKNAISIPGTGSVESLNVSVATSLCLGEFCRQHAGK